MASVTPNLGRFNMSRRSRAAQKLIAQKEKEELAKKKAAEASQTKRMSKYAAKKLAQMNAPAVDYTDEIETNFSTESTDESSSITNTSSVTNKTESITSIQSNSSLSSEQISAKVTRAINEAIPSNTGPHRRKIRSFKVRGGTVLRSSVETPAEQTARETKEAKIKASEADLPEKIKAGRAKHRQHLEDIYNARLKALDEIEARGETYKRPSNKIPDKVVFNRESVMTCGIETKDRMPDPKDPLERAAALAPHNRRDAMLFAPIKRHNSPIKGVDFMVKFLDQWEDRMDKNGIFAAFFDQVKHTRSNENGIAYIGLPAFLKFLEGTSKRLIIDQYAFEFNLYIKRREITDFIASMKAPALEWMAQRHPMDPYYAFVYIDTYPVRLKLGKKHLYAEQELFLIGVTLDGRKDLLGIIPDFTSGRLSVDFWERILQHFRDLGTSQICFVVAGFKCRYLERALKTIFPNTTLQFNLLEVLQFDSFKLPDPERKSFMEDAASLCEAPNFEVAKAQLDLMRDKWEPLMPEGAGILQGNIDLLKVYTFLSLEERKIFTTHKMIAGAASLLLGKKDQLDFFSDHAEMLNYFFYRYLLVAKHKWLECQDYAVYNLTFSSLFAKLRHSDIEGGKILDELLNQQHQDFMYRHFGRCGTGPVFNINPNRRKISISGQIEPYHSLQKVWGDELSEPQDPEQIAQQQQAASAQALALRQRAKEQARTQYEQAQRAAAATLKAAAQGAALTAAAIAQASHIEATAVAALGGINHENHSLNSENNITTVHTNKTSQTIVTTKFATITDTTAINMVTSATANTSNNSAISCGNNAKSSFSTLADISDSKITDNNNSCLPLGDSSLPAFIFNDAKTLNLQTASQNILQPRTFAANSRFAQNSGNNSTTATIDSSSSAIQDKAVANNANSMRVNRNIETNATQTETWDQLSDKDSYRPTTNAPKVNYYLDPQLSQVSADQFNSLNKSNENPINDLEKIDRTYGILPDTKTTINSDTNTSAATIATIREAKADTSDKTQNTDTLAIPSIADLNHFVEPSINNNALTSKNNNVNVINNNNANTACVATTNTKLGVNDAKQEDKSSYYLAHYREQKIQESSYAVDKFTSSGLVNRYGSYTLNIAGSNNENEIQELQAFDKFEALSLKATAPSAYLMNSVSSNIQSANAILGTLKPSIMQALRADRQILKDRERQQIFDCLGLNFNFNCMDNVIHQVTPIFRSAMQTKLNWYANHKKEEEAAARVKAKAKARARYLKRQEEKNAKAAELAAHQPVALDNFTPLHSINDINISTMPLSSEETVQEIASLRDHHDFITANPFTSPHLGFGNNNPLTLISDSTQMSLNTTNSNELRFTPVAFASNTSIGTSLEVDFAQQQLKMQPIYGGEQKSLQFAAQIQSSIKVAPTLMTSLLTNTQEQATLATSELSLQQQPNNQIISLPKKKQRHTHVTAATSTNKVANAKTNKSNNTAQATAINSAPNTAAAIEAETQAKAKKSAKNRPNNKATISNTQAKGKTASATNALIESKSDNNNTKIKANTNTKTNNQQRRGKQTKQSKQQEQTQNKQQPKQENEREFKGRRGKSNERNRASSTGTLVNEPKTKNKTHTLAVKNSAANTAVVIRSGTNTIYGAEDTKLTVTSNMLQLSEQKFTVNKSKPSFTSESLSAVSLNQAHINENGSSETNDLLRIEKTTDFNGPVPAPEIRSMLAKSLATPPGVKTAILDPQLKLNAKDKQQNTD